MITATATLTETISVTASLGGSVCLSATYALVDTDVPPNTLDIGSIASGAAATIVAPAATVTVNTAPFGTAPSGGSLNVPVKNTAGTLKGSKIGPDWVVPDATLQQNTIQRKLIPTGTSFNLVTKLDGVANNGVWDGVDTLDFTSSCPPSGSVSVAVSDTTPNFGDTITITATPTGLTPTSYLFFAFDGASITFISEQAGAVANWSVSIVGTFDIYSLATNGTIEVYSTQSITASSALILDSIPVMPNWAVGLRRLTINYLGDCMIVRRLSDGATTSIGFIGEPLNVAALVSFVGVGNGFDATLFDQIGSNNPTQGVAASQPTCVLSGTVQTINGKPTIVFDGTGDEMSMSNVTFAHGFVVAGKSSNANFLQYVLGGSAQGITLGGSSIGTITVTGSLGPVLTSAIDDTVAHQISVRMGVAGAGRLRIDGVTQSTGTTTASMTISRIGVRADVPFRHIGPFSEAFTYSAALTNPQELILEANQKAYYGTP